MTDATTGGPLLAPLTAEEWGDDEYAAFGALMGLPGDKVPRAGSGHAADPLKFDVIGLLARHPKMAQRFLSYNGWLLQRGELPCDFASWRSCVSRTAAARRSSGVSTSRWPATVACRPVTSNGWQPAMPVSTGPTWSFSERPMSS